MMTISPREATKEFRATSPLARRRARAIAHRLADLGYASHRAVIAEPHFGATASGGVDMHWTMPRLELLIAVPAARGKVVSYVGRVGESRLSGTIASDEAYALLVGCLVNLA